MIRSLLVLALLTLGLWSPAMAQEPDLQPISESLDAVARGDRHAIRDLARRCSALLLAVSVQLNEAEQDTAAFDYMRASDRFFGLAVDAEQALGTPAARAAAVNEEAIDEIYPILSKRIVRNMRSGGSYFAGDALIDGDMDHCTQIALAAFSDAPPRPAQRS